ncbi:MAG: TIGR01777 family protein [Pseudomonadales bacterium]|nr:TIGR01777 family protein [Pseudomonadales bacterium]
MAEELQHNMKNILITGATGMIGSSIAADLESIGYQVYPLVRNSSEGSHYYLQESDFIYLDPTIPLHGVINLAGQNISDKRWTEKTKQQIVDSRVKLTRTLSEAITQLPAKPEVFLSASAIGYYGTDPDKTFDESSPAGTDFLAKLSVDWEAATKPAQSAGIRTVLLRFSLVLDPDGGVLKNLVLPMRLASVGPIGSGKQTMSWIALSDALRILLRLLENEKFSGPLNVVSTQSVSNREFGEALAKSLGSISLPRIPSAIVRLMFGEMADAALLPSANIKSTRMQELDIQLEHEQILPALESMYR